MSTLNVDRLRARYRVAAGSAEHRRLDDLLRVVVDDALERSLERAGVDIAAGEVCVRELHAPVQLDLVRDGDAALAEAWADAIAAQLATRLTTGGADVVHYGSRRHALADIAASVAAGSVERAWAWQALGIWPAGEPAPGRALAAALLDEPDAIAPVLARVGRDGRLPALAARLDPARWSELAIAALVAAGVHPASAREAVEATIPGPALPVPERLRPALRRSSLAHALPLGAGAPVKALAALALVEVAPGTVADLGETLPGVVAAVAAATTPEPAVVEPPISAEAAETPLPTRPRAATEWGGLLFALHAVADLDLVARFSAELPLDGLLLALALDLVPAAPDDPAVLAFAGLAPDAEPPEPIRDAFDPLDDVVAWLAARLGLAREALDPHAVLHRHAEVVADPGWIEIQLRLEEVDVAVRRAGLDLDPGYVPFLGSVVRFVYV